MILLAGILAQSGGFFIQLELGRDNQSSLGSVVRRAGVLLVRIALIVLVISLLAGGYLGHCPRQIENTEGEDHG